jgi:hypothetical protein
VKFPNPTCDVRGKNNFRTRIIPKVPAETFAADMVWLPPAKALFVRSVREPEPSEVDCIFPATDSFKRRADTYAHTAVIRRTSLDYHDVIVVCRRSPTRLGVGVMELNTIWLVASSFL